MPSVEKGSPKKASKKTEKKAATKGREVLYEKPSIRQCVEERAMTAATARKIMGWEEETEEVKFGPDYLLKDERGNKVRCHNNISNRPLVRGNVEALVQEILRNRWRFNGEPIIIGKTGLVLNGQHTMVALVLAGQRWADDKEKWSDWDREPTIDKLVVVGVDEDDAVVNTLDTAKPRSLSDVIYRSTYFSSLQEKDRRKAARLCDNAVRLLWHRTGAALDAFAPRRTHSESLDFIARHPGILECVKHILEEDGEDGRIAKVVGPGYAAGLMYLMAASASDPKEYKAAQNPCEDSLDWEEFEKAAEFWRRVAEDAPEFRLIRVTLAKLGGGTNPERWGTIVRAWNAYAEGKKFSSAILGLSYQERDGVKVLDECPTVGGIDMGKPEPAEPEDPKRTPDPKPEKIEKEKKRVKAKATMAAKGERHNGEWAKGDTCWVSDPEGDHWFGELTEDPIQREDTGEMMAMLRAQDGKVWEVGLDLLSIDHPDLEDEAA
jgi:hypothetical protein